MNRKDKVLVGIIADMEIDARMQDLRIDETDDNLACAEDTIVGLTDEKIQAGETYHAAMVEKNARIKELEEMPSSNDCSGCGMNEILEELRQAKLEKRRFKTHLMGYGKITNVGMVYSKFKAKEKKRSK